MQPCSKEGQAAGSGGSLEGGRLPPEPPWREAALQRPQREEIVKEDADRDSGCGGNGEEPTEVTGFTFKLDGETRSCASAQGVWRLMMQGWRLVDTSRFDEMMDVLTSRETAPVDGGGFDAAAGEPPAG